jgi:energy-coupling factor transporter ATP-binding protein EcfA2
MNKPLGSEAERVCSPLAEWACSHPFYDQVFQWTMNRIFSLSDPSVLLVIGPTGVGKTNMIRHMVGQLAHRMTGAMKENPSRLHKVYAEACYVAGRGFDWEGLFTDFLKDANELLVSRKTEKVWPPEKHSLKSLAAAVNTMLLHHAPPVAIIDEGGSFAESASDESLDRVLGFLKSIGNRSRTHLLIFGDYRMAKMSSLNGQLNRRCHVIHFSNYPASYRDHFDLVVATFEKRLRLKNIHTDLQGSSDFLFSETCGCVGILKRWLEDAWINSRETDRPIDLRVLEGSRMPAGSVTKWRAEIANGHDKMKEFFLGQDVPTGGK